MKNELLDLNDIFVKKTFNTKEDFFDFISCHLIEENKVKNTFETNILDREKTFPTGLDTGKIGVAIPHTGYENSNTNQIVITTLASPLGFNKMDDPNDVVEVSVILLILFDKPEKQPEILKQIMAVIQNQEFLEALLKQDSAESIVELFKR